MSHSWTKTWISGVAGLSLAAALVVSVFSQSHAALGDDVQAGATEPCADHMDASANSPADESCETLCYSADLNHLLGVAVDRTPLPDFVTLAVSYGTQPIAELANKRSGFVHSGRDPPGTDTYLITQRLRL